MSRSSRPTLKPHELVILAEDDAAMTDWYVEILGFRVVRRFTEGYRYTNLATESGLRIGIAPASEVGVTPGDRAGNPVLLQVEVPDVNAFFDHLEQTRCTILSGPSHDRRGGFWFGSFADLEGNPIWVVDSSCP